MNTAFIGDTGTEITLDCGVDISSATVMKILAKPPRGAVKQWSAQLEGSRTIKYVLQPNDLHVPGVWVLQAYVEMPGWQGRGLPVELKVKP